MLGVVTAFGEAGVPPASALHVPGATYTGTHSGLGTPTTSGAVQFTVSPERSDAGTLTGEGIVGFRVTNLQPGTTMQPPYVSCGPVSLWEQGFSAESYPPIVIEGGAHKFSYQDPNLTWTPRFESTHFLPGASRLIMEATGSVALYVGGALCGIPAHWQATTKLPDSDGDGWPNASPWPGRDDYCPTSPGPDHGCDVDAPAFTLRGGRLGRSPAQKGVFVQVACPMEPCAVTARGTVSVPAAARVYRLKSATKRLAVGGRGRLELRFSKRVVKVVKRAVRARRKVRARVTVTVKDAAGNRASRKLSIKL